MATDDGEIEIKNVMNAIAPVQYRWNNGLNQFKNSGAMQWNIHCDHCRQSELFCFYVF